MGLYANIVSTTKEIKQIRTFVEGIAKDIKSIWTFVEGQRKLIYPSNNLIVNLSGASKYEDDAVWPAGKYRIEIAPGVGYNATNLFPGVTQTAISRMNHIETIDQPFIVRAYCGGNASAAGIGTNPYSGTFKVNGRANNVHENGIDVNHIFGAGGGNSYNEVVSLSDSWVGGGPNCLGNGSTEYGTGVATGYVYGGAGSCLHLIPVGGTFGTDFIRAYHVAPQQDSGEGSAYGGAQAGYYNNVGTSWFTRGGNSPYGNGGTTQSAAGAGIGAGGKTISVTEQGITYNQTIGAGAYFNGSMWVDEPGNIGSNGSSYIRITYLGEN